MRPFSIALTMEQKLSSVRIMSDAPFATSVPSRPMATPISARCSAGASLTPSPVIALTHPWRCNDLTISSLSSGLARANTAVVADMASICSLLRYFPSLPGRSAPQSVAVLSGDSPSRMMPMFLAMAIAVPR